MSDCENQCVYLILVDSQHKWIGLKIRDSLLPPKQAPLGKLISPFACPVGPRQQPDQSLREILTSLSKFGMIVPVEKAQLVYHNMEDGIMMHIVETSLHVPIDTPSLSSSLSHIRDDGQGFVISFANLAHSDVRLFAPGMREAILAAIHPYTP